MFTLLKIICGFYSTVLNLIIIVLLGIIFYGNENKENHDKISKYTETIIIYSSVSKCVMKALPEAINIYGTESRDNPKIADYINNRCDLESLNL